MKIARVLVAFAIVLLGAWASFTGSWPWKRTFVAAPIVVDNAWTEIADTLHRGETISELLARQRVVGLNLQDVVARSRFDPRRARTGMIFNFRRPRLDSVPTEFSVRTGAEQRLQFLRADSGGWTTEIQPIAWRQEVVRIEGPIDNSLYVALDEGVDTQLLGPGERVRLAWDLADVYAWSVDFTRDIRSGDRFQVVLEREVSDEGEVRFGRILASDLSVNGRSMTAYRFETASGAVSYYDADGESLRRAFLRAPLQFRRISSSFNRSRRHPILGYARRHEGTDYSAAYGTPVLAAGEGTVIQAGRAGGYGNLIEIRHANGITTRYGHLSTILVRSGSRVSQAQVIGRVGATGLATASHLHYEFRVNGVARDSRRLDLGNGKPVASADRPAFELERGRLSAELYPSATPAMAQLGD
ncbi:MAG: M23 family metallopeptidase [Gemmatimonadales bacterium]|jgi:murein DD-endopeptidase MepM/ murein hydrolase activator NlpD|nr:MAG: M23 family metallopeptidase [Gemmatimonadales bacterium]